MSFENQGFYLNYLKPQKFRVLLLALAILGSIALDLVSPQIIRSFIDHAVAGSAIPELTRIAFNFLAVALVAQFISLAVTYLGQVTAWTATNALRVDLTLHCLQLDMLFYKVHAPGELIERIDGDISELAKLFSHTILRLFANGLLIVAVLVLLFLENIAIGLVSFFYILLTGLAMSWIQNKATKTWEDARQANADLFSFLGERLTGIEDICANGAVPYVMNCLHRLLRALYMKHIGAQMTGSLTFIAGYSAFTVTLVAVLGMGALLYLQNSISIGTVFLLVSYVSKLDAPLKEIQRHVFDLQRAAASARRVNDLFNIQPTLVDKGSNTLPSEPLSITFENVSFCYPDLPPDNDSINGNMLTNISFQLPPGRVLGLLGRTGSGKTTLARLLLRLYDPKAGVIRLGKIDLRSVELHDLRQHIGLVTQEVQLFEATIRDNLALFNHKIPDETIVAVLYELGLGSWYAALPEGLDTKLKAGSKDLSAGEGQLLTLARVFLRDPAVVVMDEASSRLDPSTEQLLGRAMARLFTGRTVIVIAHRLATVQHADEILILEKGRVEESGARIELLNNPFSRFSHLMRVGLEEVMK